MRVVASTVRVAAVLASLAVAAAEIGRAHV